MTPERERLLEAVRKIDAVLEKARLAINAGTDIAGALPFVGEARGLLDQLFGAALRAHDAAPQVVGETVEVRGCIGRSEGGDFYAYGGASDSDEELRAMVEGAAYEPVCMFVVRAPATRPVVPVIPATVEEVKR